MEYFICWTELREKERELEGEEMQCSDSDKGWTCQTEGGNEIHK